MSAWTPVPLGPVGYPLPSHSHGYPLVYLTIRERPLCADCANDLEHGPVAYVGVHEDGEAIECDECSAEIPSYYGPVLESYQDLWEGGEPT